MKLVVLDGFTANPGDLDWKALEKIGELSVYDSTEPGEVLERLQGADVAITNKVRMTEEIMAALPDLKYIGILATGTDCVDLAAAKKRGIVVTNVPAYSNHSVAQLTFALILELCHRVDRHNQSVTQEKFWSRQPYNSYWLNPLTELYGKTLGVIGTGKIGQRVIAIGKAFGMNVVVYSRTKRDIPDVTWLTLEELLRTSDVVSINCPLTEVTRGMINRETLGMMKRSAFFINTSRGPLMVDQDLADALNNGVIAGAGLDVLGKEPPEIDNPLLNAKNVIITPHIGWATMEARRRLIDITADNIAAFINHEDKNVVNK